MKYWQISILLILGQLCFGQGSHPHAPNRILVKFSDTDLLKNIDLKQNTFNISGIEALERLYEISHITPINPNSAGDLFVIEFKFFLNNFYFLRISKYSDSFGDRMNKN